MSGTGYVLKTNPFTLSIKRIVSNVTNNTFVGVGNGGEIARSSDDGQTWGASLITNPFSGSDITSIGSNGDVFIK